jgi:hypothetical protein
MQHPRHLGFVYTWHGHLSLYWFEIGKKERNGKRKESNAWIWWVKRGKNSTLKFRALQYPMIKDGVGFQMGRIEYTLTFWD